MAISGIATSNRQRCVTGDERLAKNWNILIERTRKTIEATTPQHMIRALAGTKLVRRFWTNDQMLRYWRLKTHMFTDTMESKITSKWQNKYMQVFVVPLAWFEAYPLVTEIYFKATPTMVCIIGHCRDHLPGSRGAGQLYYYVLTQKTVEKPMG
jgi:hypothetical protein